MERFKFLSALMFENSADKVPFEHCSIPSWGVCPTTVWVSECHYIYYIFGLSLTFRYSPQYFIELCEKDVVTLKNMSFSDSSRGRVLSGCAIELQFNRGLRLIIGWQEDSQLSISCKTHTHTHMHSPSPCRWSWASPWQRHNRPARGRGGQLPGRMTECLHLLLF